MAGFLAQALSVLLKENDALISYAKTLGGVAACRWHDVRQVRNLRTDATHWEYVISFDCEEDVRMFDAAVRDIVDAVTEKKE